MAWVIDKLEFLIALARERHFGRAAELSGVTQPTLSAGIRQLEEGLGARLVDRGARFRGFTPEGERVLEWARRIVGDARAMRQEVVALRQGLTGHLRLAAIPTALPVTTALTAPFCRRYPEVRFSIRSETSINILAGIDNLDVDAGVTYLDNERLGRVGTIPLYRERFRFVTDRTGRFAERSELAWVELDGVRLCLLTPDMQNRRIIDGILAGVGVRATATVESNSLLALFAHVRTGLWTSVMPEKLIEAIGLPDTLRAIRLVAPDASYTVGLVVKQRERMTPLTAALVAEARRIGAGLETDPPTPQAE